MFTIWPAWAAYLSNDASLCLLTQRDPLKSDNELRNKFVWKIVVRKEIYNYFIQTIIGFLGLISVITCSDRTTAKSVLMGQLVVRDKAISKTGLI